MIKQICDLNEKIPPRLLKAAIKIENTLIEAGYTAYLVGGSIRNILLGLPIKDIDYTTDAHPEQLKKLFKRVVPVCIELGTVVVIVDCISSEITTFRSDNDYTDGRRPNQVEFSKTLQEDVIRRDFTINGLAYSVTRKLLIDYVSGLRDLESKVLRTIGNPIDRFSEDGLRSVRGCRFAALLQFSMEKTTEEAIKKTLDVSKLVAKERFYDEWKKTLKSKFKHQFWALLLSTGLANIFVDETKIPKFNNLEDTQFLKHGRPISMGMYALYLFWQNRERLTENDLNQLKFPKKESRLAIDLADSALLKLYLSKKINSFEIKKSLSRISPKNLRFHIRLVRDYDNIFIRKSDISRKLIMSIRNIFLRKEPIHLSDLAINGDDLIGIGYRGKEIKDALLKAQEKVWAEPAANQRKSLIALLS